jgi:hypothetical protein
MQIFRARIKGIAERKVLSRGIQRKTPNLTYQGLSQAERTSLTLALINEDESLHELIAQKITYALEDAYCDLIRVSEAEEDAIDLSILREQDARDRARDMNLAIQGQ